MPKPRSAMRRIKEVLRLRAALGDNISAIATGAGVSRSSVRKHLNRAEAAGIAATAAAAMADDALEAALFPPRSLPDDRVMPDSVAIDQDLWRHRHVTLKLLWVEYKAATPDGFGLTQFKLFILSGAGNLGPVCRCTGPTKPVTPFRWTMPATRSR